jgi:type IV conjugative transfer system protein TraL
MGIKVFRTLDNPPRFLFWPIDEFVAVFSPFILMLATSGGFLFLLIGLPLALCYVRIKRKFPHKSLRLWIYWNVPLRDKKLRKCRLPESHQREFLL